MFNLTISEVLRQDESVAVISYVQYNDCMLAERAGAIFVTHKWIGPTLLRNY